jgi:hypothetical protein
MLEASDVEPAAKLFAVTTLKGKVRLLDCSWCRGGG